MGRRAVSTELDRFVAANRFTLAVVVPLVGAVLLVASARGWLPATLAFSPVLILFGTVAMRLPLIAAVLPTLDRRAVLGLAALSGYAYGIEFVGLRFGWPYGAFEYGVDLGPMVAGVPLALPLFFGPLVINAVLLARRLTLPGHRWRRRLLALAIVMAIDLVLDPAAVAIGFWSYDPAGPIYGVPVSNYAGWLLSGTVGVLLVDAAFRGPGLDRRLDRCPFALDDLVSFVLLWGAINLAYGQWVVLPVVGLLVVGLWRVNAPGVTRLPWPIPSVGRR